MLGAPTGKLAAAHDLISTLKHLHGGLKAKLSKARSAYKEQDDKFRRPHPALVLGDLFIVEAKNFKLPFKSRKQGFITSTFKAYEQIN